MKGERIETEISLNTASSELHEEEKADEDVIKEVKRKESVNENNVLGLNLQIYESLKPNHSIRLKIKNFIDEYFQEKNQDLALEEAREVCEGNKIQKVHFVGYTLIAAFSKD